MDKKNNKFIFQKVFFTFFGSNSLPENIVVITPVSKILNTIKNTFPVIEKTKGWWERILVKIKPFQVTILKIPSGANYINDCLEILDIKKIKEIIFLGYCASLDKKIKIGQIVIPDKALFGKREIELFKSKTLIFPNRRKYKIALTHRLLLPKKEIKKIKAHLVDMETYFLYKFSKTKNIPAFALLIVTDNPIYYPFYNLSRLDKIKLNSFIRKLIFLLKRHILALDIENKEKIRTCTF